MKHWEEEALLTEVLDRHARRLVEETGDSDWIIVRLLEPFLGFIRDEPALRSFVEEYIDEARAISQRVMRGMEESLEQAVSLVKSTGTNESALVEAIESAREKINDRDAAKVALAALRLWAEGRHESQPDLALKARGLCDRHRAFFVRFVQFSETNAGAAYFSLVDAARKLNFAVQETAPSVANWNAEAERLHQRIEECELFGGRNLSQPGVTNIQRKVRTLHLALVTSLARGRSRWATVKRFAARCESLDRERLRAGLNDTKGKPEAFLTLEFARYLFDAGYNPLVDAAACGLRPDVLDVTAEPAIYVEAKQYEDVGEATQGNLRKGLAQTLSTWSRLSKRWSLPEAFLLIFRRSGRPLAFENSELRINGGRLYVLFVDLADAAESGSRADVPVRVDLKTLLAGAKEGRASENMDNYGER